jgi:hypothetical protein
MRGFVRSDAAAGHPGQGETRITIKPDGKPPIYPSVTDLAPKTTMKNIASMEEAE